MKVRVINLERSFERRDAIGAQLNALGIPHSFFRAVDASLGEHRVFTNGIGDRPGRNGKPLTAGEQACFASHYLVWKETIDRNESVVVLEDDDLLSAGAVEALKVAERTMDSWPFVRLCGLIERPFTILDGTDGFQIVRYRRGPSGSQAYSLTPEGARHLVAKAVRWEEPLDDYLDRFWFHGVPCIGLLPYRIKPGLANSVIGERPGYTAAQKFRRKMHHIPDGFRRTLWNLRHV